MNIWKTVVFIVRRNLVNSLGNRVQIEDHALESSGLRSFQILFVNPLGKLFADGFLNKINWRRRPPGVHSQMAKGTTCGLHSYQETDGETVTDTVCCVKSIEGEDHPSFFTEFGQRWSCRPMPPHPHPLSIIIRSDPIRPDVISGPARPDPTSHPIWSIWYMIWSDMDSSNLMSGLIRPNPIWSDVVSDPIMDPS